MKKLFSKSFKNLLLTLLFLGALIAIPAVVLAHHNDVIQTANCQGWQVKGIYSGGNGYRRAVWNFDLNGVNQSGSWQGISSGRTLFDVTGTGEVDADGYLKLYQLSIHGWQEVDNDTINLHFHDNCNPEPTPTGEPTPTPEDTPTPTPTTTPIVTATPKEEPKTENVSTTNTPSCPLEIPERINEIWYTDYMVAGGEASLILHWGQSDRYPAVNIAYGENINQWRYGVLNVEDNGAFHIGGLKPNQSYWFQLAYTEGCRVGQYSTPIDP